MSEQPAESVPAEQVQKPAPPSLRKQRRRSALSTGFSDVPGKTCEVCGYQGFRWQTTCPKGHPLT